MFNGVIMISLWMGAASGNLVSIANVIRMCLRFGNMATLEDGYGINLLPLATFRDGGVRG